MSKKTKIFIFANVIASILLLIAISTVMYSWYVNINQTNNVDVTTNGVIVTYEIDTDSKTTDTNSYTISDLVFFDEDSDFEGKFFTKMAHLVRFDITNKSKKSVDITLANNTNYSSNIANKTPYATCVIAKTNAYDSTLTTYTTSSVEGYIDDVELSKSSTITNVAVDDFATFYVYVYGVQPNDEATNDFLSETYSFDLTITATISSGQGAIFTTVSNDNTTTVNEND